MDKYYYIFSPASFSGLCKKYTYKQYIAAAQNALSGSFWKVLKTDYTPIEKALKSVIVKDKVQYIFNRLHAAGKAARA